MNARVSNCGLCVFLPCLWIWRERLWRLVNGDEDTREWLRGCVNDRRGYACNCHACEYDKRGCVVWSIVINARVICCGAMRVTYACEYYERGCVIWSRVMETRMGDCGYCVWLPCLWIWRGRVCSVKLLMMGVQSMCILCFYVGQVSNYDERGVVYQRVLLMCMHVWSFLLC